MRLRILLPMLLGLPLGVALVWASAHAARLAHTPTGEEDPERGPGPWPTTAGRLGWWEGGGAAAASVLLVVLELRFDRFWSRPLVLAASIFFLLVAMVDLRHRLVPDAMVLPAGLIALGAQLAVSSDALVTALIGGAFGLAPFLATALVKPGGMGGGDVKLAGLMGLILGFPRVIWALAVAIVAGGIVSLVLLLSREWEPSDHLPYAPFLCLGAVAALLYDPLTPFLLSLAR